MKKFTKFIATATAALLALGFAGCTKTTGGSGPVTYPPFINADNTGGGDDKPTSEKYVVNVLSDGGMKLNGVQVALKRGDTVVRRGISRNGVIEFATELGSYQLEVDESTLPAGYYLQEGRTYSTNPTNREEVTIRLSSRLLPASANVESYAPGNIMRDFTITDIDGRSHTLSTLLSTRKAVVLNFFFTTCGPCRSEFPYLQTAYNNRTTNDIEVLAICTRSMSDSNTTIAGLKMELGLTFPMALDTIGLCNAFGVSNYPTTVVIDRYGMIALRDSGGRPSSSFWSQMFNRFTATNYVQDITGSGDNPGDNPSGELVKPTEQMPASSVMAAAALDNAQATFRGEVNDEYSWPWKAGSDADGGYIYSSNKGVNNSYAIVHADIALKANDVLSFEYKISSEANADYLYVLLDGVQMNTGYSGGDGDWHSINLYVSDRAKTVDLAFVYRKDAGDPPTGIGDDVAMIRKINVSDASQIENDSPLDIMRECASGNVVDNRYSHYVDYALNPADGFYHVVAEREAPVGNETVGAVKTWGPIIYMTINQLTPWSDLHAGSTSTAPDGSTYSNTIFRMTENKYYRQFYVTNEETGDRETDYEVKIGGVDVKDAYTVYVTIMSYMPAPYYLIPVTESLKGWADALVADFEKGTQHDNEWLEFCYYYDHYGVEHDNPANGDGGTCKVDVDYTRGLTRFNAYTAHEKSELENMTPEEKAALEAKSYNKNTGRNKATIDFPLQLAHNGTYYRFTAKEAGVYQIRSYTKGCSPTTASTADNTDSYVTADPALSIYYSNGENLRTVDGTLDHDAFKGENYEGFNTYLPMEAGEEILLYLETTAATRSYYDFEIIRHDNSTEPFKKMLVCSTGGGAWTWYNLEDGGVMYTYLGINVMYDDISGTYCAVKDGKPDPEQPVYIDMIYSSFFTCDISDYYFATLQYMIRHNAFRAEKIYQGARKQATMNRLLGEATNKAQDDPLYGLVPATHEIVDILNEYIHAYAGGRGEGNGWLAFAVYDATIG